MLSTLTKERAVESQDRTLLFESLLRSSYRQAYNLACRLTGNPAEAEDLVQETFVRAYRFFHRYDEALPFTSWLYRIMTNAHIDGVRRKGRLKTLSLEQPGANGSGSWDIPDANSAPDREMMHNAMGEQVQLALTMMNPEFRTAVLLADVQGMAYEEIAEIMQTSIGTVRSRIHRGRKQLRRTLVKHSPEVYGGAK